MGCDRWVVVSSTRGLQALRPGRKPITSDDTLHLRGAPEELGLERAVEEALVVIDMWCFLFRSRTKRDETCPKAYKLRCTSGVEAPRMSHIARRRQT